MIKHETPGALATLMGIALLSLPARTWSSQRLCQCPEVTWLLSMHVEEVGAGFHLHGKHWPHPHCCISQVQAEGFRETWPVIMLDFTFKSHPLT